MSWKAHYLIGSLDSLTKSEFETEEKAWEYVFSHMCNGCKEERKLALVGIISIKDSDWENSLFPSCSAEWIVDEEL